MAPTHRQGEENSKQQRSERTNRKQKNETVISTLKYK